jgi:hypothetical protein
MATVVSKIRLILAVPFYIVAWIMVFLSRLIGGKDALRKFYKEGSE